MRTTLLAAILFTSALPLTAGEPCVTLDDKTVAALFDDWNFGLSSLDATQVTQRYWPDAVLLPTVSNTPRTNPAAIDDYFQHFLAKRPRGHIDSRTVQSGCNLAVDMGTYTFSLMDDKGTTSEVAARYTFVYQYRAGAWKILHHHSSAMPERAMSAAADEKPEPADAHAAARAAPPEPVRPLSRKERWAMRKDVIKPQAPMPTNHKPASTPATEAKPAKAAQVPAKTRSPAAAEPAKAAPDAKAPASDKPPAAALATEKTPTDAKMPAEVRTAMFANLTASPAPAKFYPPEAMRRKERGNVNLKVCADSEGAVSEFMEVVKSSGSKLLDDAAMSWARQVTWVPATFNRQRVEGCAKVDVWFEPPPDLANART